jgi:hypothetical protein
MKTFKIWICSSLYTIWNGTELDWNQMIRQGNCHSNTIKALSEYSVLQQCKESYPNCQFKIELV